MEAGNFSVALWMTSQKNKDLTIRIFTQQNSCIPMKLEGLVALLKSMLI